MDNNRLYAYLCHNSTTCLHKFRSDYEIIRTKLIDEYLARSSFVYSRKFLLVHIS